MGRPKKFLDEEQIRQLALIQCTYEEIAAVMKVNRTTIIHRFSTLIKEAWESGKGSLRRAQYKAALGGNSTMLVWLGKQYLDQKDSHQVEHTGKVVMEHEQKKKIVSNLRRALEHSNN